MSGRLVATILVFTLAVLVYAQTVSGSFVYDDVTEILTNPRVHRIENIPALLTSEFWHDVPGWAGIYRPVTASTIPLLFAVGEGSPVPFHVANIILHGLVSCLLTLVLMRLTGRTVAPVVSGILFAVHPVHVEAVAWISGRSELLFACTGAAAWWFHLKAREGGRFWSIGAAVALLALSMGSKETAACWLPIIIVADWLYPAAKRRPSGIPYPGLYASYAAVMAIWLAARLVALGGIGARPFEGSSLLNPLSAEPWWPSTILTVLRVTGLASLHSIAPYRACIDYGYNEVLVARSPWQLDVILVGSALAAMAIWAGRAIGRGRMGPGVRFGILASAVFIFAWLPASNLLLPSVSIFAERNLYLPSLGWCMVAGAISAALWRGGRGRRVVVIVGAMVLAIVCRVTIERSALFRSSGMLFEATARSCPESAHAHYLHASALESSGRNDEALEAYRRALDIAPSYTDARAAMSLTLARLGRADEAGTAARVALAAGPRSIETRVSILTALAAAGLREEADDVLRTLAEEHPTDQRVLFANAQMMRLSGRLAEALAVFRTMSELFPESPIGPDGIGAIHMMRGETAEARQAFEVALERAPYDISATYNLGILSLNDAASRGAGEAADRFRRYTVLVPEDPVGWVRLGQAHEHVGDHASAEAAYMRARKIAPDHPLVLKALERLRKRS